MEDKSLELLTEEGRRFYDEFTRCETMEEIEELEKKWSKLNKSQENNVIPHYDMTLEELDEKYGLVSHEEVWKNVLNNMVNYTIEEADAALETMTETILSEFNAACDKIDAEHERGNTAVQLTNEEHLVSIKHAIGEELTAYENQLYLMVSNIETELEMQKQWLKKFIGQGFAFTNKNPNAFITKLTFIFERVSILHSDRTILVGAVISNKETNSTDSIAIDLTTGDIQYRERKGKYMYDLEVMDESKASWEDFVHELRRRLWNRNYVN